MIIEFLADAEKEFYKKGLAEIVFFDYIKSSTGDWVEQSSLAI